MASSQPVVEETWVQVLKESFFCRNPSWEAIQPSLLGNGIKHQCDIPWQQPTKVNLDTSCCKIKNSHILPTGQWYAPSAVNYSALSCTFLHYLALSCTILYYLALSCTILHYLALSCTILHYLSLSCIFLHYLALSCTLLHYLALSCTILKWCPVVPIRYTCYQQMSPVIAFI